MLATGVCALALAAAAPSAMAQTHAPAPNPAAAAGLQVNSGPPIAGVCLFSEPQVLQQSTVGQAVRTRMEQLVSQVRAELQPLQAGIETDGKALEAARPSLDQATFQKRAADLNLRVNALQHTGQLRQQELEATERKAVARIDSEISPVLRDVYQQHTCSLLIDRGSVLVANPAMDLTPNVITALNGRITTFDFEREQLPDQPGQQGQ